MIIGLLTIMVLLVIRLGGNVSSVPLPNGITLPDGTVATAFTRGPNWFAIVTDDDEILIYDAQNNDLRQTIKISPK
jgi:hypothetical protein